MDARNHAAAADKPAEGDPDPSVENLGHADGHAQDPHPTPAVAIDATTSGARHGGPLKLAWAAAGFLCFGLAAIGAFLPVIPTVPLLILAGFCFARSSRRVDDWFHSTKLYHDVLEGFVSKRTMTRKAKLMMLVPLSVVFLVALFFMRNVRVPFVIVLVVWIAHLLYFGIIVPTEPEPASEPRTKAR